MRIDDPDIRQKIKDYWEDPETISLLDGNLRKLEIETASRHLSPDDRLADVGCGDASSTLHYARLTRECVGFERSERLRQTAEATAREAGISNISFRHADLLVPDSLTGEEPFDVVVTERVLINLPSWGEQKAGIEAIRRLLKPGGRYIMIENTNQGFEALNEMRASVGLGPIPQHWHNLFFDHDALLAFMGENFELVQHHNYSVYYFLTRVYVPMFASFTGYGAAAKKDAIFSVADEAARRLFEGCSERVSFPGCPSLGPIQGFVFRRIA